jgi:hypothetical protein
MEGSKDRYSYTENSKILENHENIYLVEHQNVYKNSSYDTKVIYNIYVLMDEKYDFQITFSEQNKEKITEIYEKIKENYSTGYFAVDKDNVIIKMTKNKNSDESVDISNWTFATDLIQDFYKKNYGFNSPTYGIAISSCHNISRVINKYSCLFNSNGGIGRNGTYI